MSHVFISHAAPDKLVRVKPLVHALAIEGVRLWLDRPGAGDSHFNFDEEFIHRHGIEGLRSGVGYDIGIREALRACSAVLVCLSRSAIDPERRVLQQEMTIGWFDEKVVPCIVDDLPYKGIPSDLGLPDLVRTQCERVNSAGLQQCLAWLGADAARTPDGLPTALKPAWQTVRKIRDDLAAAAQRSTRTPVAAMPPARVVALQALLAGTARPLPLLLRMYRRALPDPARELPAPTLTELLRDLDDCRPRQPLLPSPLIEFAERLARSLGDAALRQWLDAHTADDRSAYAALQHNLDAEQQQRAKVTLFVDVDPDVLHQIRWWLQAPDPRHCSSEQLTALTEPLETALPKCLGQGLALARDKLGSDNGISVALLLPPKWLAAGLDSLDVQVDDDDELGSTLAALYRRYPVTLHWRKRLGARGQSGKAAINAWNSVLDMLDQRIAQGAGASVAWVDPEAQAALLDPLAGAVARLRDPADDAVCIGLGPLAPASARRLNDEVAACLREGVPCFFWFGRPQPVAADTWRQAVCSEFARHSPVDAPNKVGLLRKISGAASPFASLCVVWDVPDLMRLPDTLSL